MKYTRRDILKTTGIAVGAATLGTFSSMSATAADASVFNDRGLWTWIPRQIVEEQDEQDRFFTKAETHGIGTLFAHYDAVGELEDPLAAAPDADIEAFLRRCHDNDIEVHPMIGGGIAGWEAPKVYPHAEQAKEWNQNHPAEESFDGLHIDVENGTWQQIRDDLLDQFDNYPDELTISMAQHPAWVRHNDNEELRTLMEHRNLDFYCTMVYDLNEATFWPNFGRSVQPWETPYVLGQGGNEHGHPNRNWSDADNMYSWVETNFVTEGPPTKYQYVDETTQQKYIGFSLHSYWALIPAPQGETIGSPSRDYQTDPGSDGGGDDNESPNASFTVDPSEPEPGEEVTLDASESSDVDGSIESYKWELGDGNSATGQTVTNSYESGEYTVTLTVTDDDGATATTSQSVSVSSDNTGPNASFAVDPSSPAPDEEVTFDASGSSDADGTIASYEWDLGDGSSATGQSVTNSYESGEYTVTLTVTDDSGATDTDSVTVTVESEDDSCSAPAWDASETYTGGEQVAYDGSIWEANWWTQGDEPGASQWGPWEEIESCDGDDDEDGDDGSNCGDVPAYQSDTIYTGGDQAVHNGILWEAEWWTRDTEPAESAAVWTKIDTCDEP